jgi:magnesium-transporting ATPase (P-type)
MIEFSSARKRMTSVFRAPDGTITVQIKGADSVIIPLLDRNHASYRYVGQTEANMEEYAKIGLRTLVIAQKTLKEHKYQDWNTKYIGAVSSVENREEMMEECAKLIENNFELVGATAIEDKL